MSTISEYYAQLVNSAFNGRKRVKVSGNFHGQMCQIKNLLKNDYTALISTILEFMIQCATVDITFNSNNIKLTKLFEDIKVNLNANLNMDIPRGLRSFTEQYFRERWKSSFIGVRIRWGKKEGFIVPEIMHVFDGASLYAKNAKNILNKTEYYFGKPSNGILLTSTESETFLIRKPYNSWYDAEPTPYLVHVGALYHALFKQAILDQQGEVLNTAIPYQMYIKAGTDEMIRKQLNIQESDLIALQEKYKKFKQEYDDNTTLDKTLIGAFPFHVNFEELIPDYAKVLDEKVLKSTDKNLLSALGLIELKGFSTTREEAILNPKVLVEEVNDAVLDYVELLNEIVILTKEKNIGKYNLNDKVVVNPGIIKSFITDPMRSMIRSWYDRGVVGQKDGLESSTPLDFETQVIQREKEDRENLNIKMYPRVTQNLEKDPADLSPENVPDDKKKGTPEVKNYDQAEETEYITEPMKTIRSIPDEIRNELNNEAQQIFKNSFNTKFEECTALEYDDYLREKTSMEYAYQEVRQYMEAPYKNNKNLPKNITNPLPSAAQTIWRNVFNESVANGDSEDVARKKAWGAVKNAGYEKDSKSNKWVKK